MSKKKDAPEYHRNVINGALFRRLYVYVRQRDGWVSHVDTFNTFAEADIVEKSNFSGFLDVYEDNSVNIRFNYERVPGSLTCFLAQYSSLERCAGAERTYWFSRKRDISDFLIRCCSDRPLCYPL